MPSSALPLSILIVEDDRAWSAMVTRLFQTKEPAARCQRATDLASALPLLETPGLDLVLLDLNLPDSRGLPTLERVRRTNWETTIVVMTADSDEDLALQALRGGAQDYFMKGKWDPAALLRAARLSRERMASELRLRRSEELFLTISENMMDLLSILDPQGRRVFTSPSYAHTLGYDRDHLDEVPSLEEGIHPEDLPKVKAALAELFAKGGTPSVECRARHRDGSYRMLEARAVRFEGVRGEGYRAMVVARDVTEVRQAERARAELEVHLRQAQKMESVGQLASGIAHEINTPIQFVNVNLTFLKKSFIQLLDLLDLHRKAAAGLDPEVARQLARAEEDLDLPYLRLELPKVMDDSLEGVQRVAKIVRAMKEFTHPGVAEATLLDVNRLIGSAATIARNEWKYVAKMDLDLEEALPAVMGSSAGLNQVFLNLIVNAAHAIGERQSSTLGTIRISTRHVGDGVEIRVRDTGMGIPVEHQSRIFEPFFTTKEIGKGTGQGLTICYQNVVQVHGGRISFETTPGEGTTFVVHLPVA